jgi:hypothetical protein
MAPVKLPGHAPGRAIQQLPDRLADLPGVAAVTSYVTMKTL